MACFGFCPALIQASGCTILTDQHSLQVIFNAYDVYRNKIDSCGSGDIIAH